MNKISFLWMRSGTWNAQWYDVL